MAAFKRIKLTTNEHELTRLKSYQPPAISHQKKGGWHGQKRSVAMFVICGVILLFTCNVYAEKSIGTLMEEATYQEETVGDVNAAIGIYEKVIADDEARRPQVARAMYRAGMCYLKKSDKDKAAKLFNDVVAKFADQKVFVTKAQKELDKLPSHSEKSNQSTISYKYALNLKKKINVNASKSPDGDRLTVQYAVIEVCKAADVPYQWDKSQKLAGEKSKLYMDIARFENQAADEALNIILEPVGLSYGIDDGGVYLADINEIVKKAALTISTCAEDDPRVRTSLESLKPLDDTVVVKELVKYLGSNENEVRRSAIYVLWRGEFTSIAPAVAELEKLCLHEEDYTRGMAALTLGGNKVKSSFTLLEKMTLTDQSGYARRCAAYALGLLGDPQAKPILEKALTDSDKMVQDNAKAALRMFELNSSATIAKPGEADKKEAETLTTQGWQLWKERKLAEAEETFKKAIIKDPQAEGAYQGLGWAQLNQGKKLNAEESFKKCVELNPKNSAALNGLGWIAKGQNKTDEAIDWWKKAVEAAPGATAALQGLGETYLEKKQYDKASEYYTQILKYEPQSKRAQIGLEKANNKGTLKVDIAKIQALIKELDNPNAPQFEALNALVDIGEPAVEPLIKAMKDSNNWQIAKALGAIKDKQAVKPLIEKWQTANFSPMKEVIAEALESITGQKIWDRFGKMAGVG